MTRLLHRGWVAALLIGLLGLGGCSKPEQVVEEPVPDLTVSSLKDWNLIVIVVDSLRADHVGAYGYERDTTPVMDRLAGEGLVFEKAMANSSYLSQSLSALFSGRAPTSGGTIGMFEAYPHDETPTLPELFGRAGYYTGIVTNQGLIKGRGFTKGFADIQIGGIADGWSGEEVAQRAVEFVEDAGEDNFFLYMHLMDPHEPYDPPDAFREKFARDAGAEALNPVEFRRDPVAFYKKHGAEATADHASIRALVDRYDGEVAYSDHCIGQLLEALGPLDVLARTAVVVTSDYGDEFLDHGYLGHAWTLYEEALHVPLIVWAPGAIGAARVPQRISHVDLMPTLLALFEVPADAPPFDGQSCFDPAEAGFKYVPSPGPHIAELVIRERAILRTVVDGNWKYMAAQFWAGPSERRAVAVSYNARATAYADGSEEPPALWGSAKYEALFNLRTDPGETTDVSGKGAEVVARMREALAAYQARCESEGIQPRMAAGSMNVLDPSEIEDLESLGYL